MKLSSSYKFPAPPRPEERTREVLRDPGADPGADPGFRDGDLEPTMLPAPPRPLECYKAFSVGVSARIDGKYTHNHINLLGGVILDDLVFKIPVTAGLRVLLIRNSHVSSAASTAVLIESEGAICRLLQV